MVDEIESACVDDLKNSERKRDSDSAPGPHDTKRLKQEAQSELNQSRIVILSADDAELRIPEGGSGICKAHAIEEIENLGPELQADSFGDLGIFEGA